MRSTLIASPTVAVIVSITRVLVPRLRARRSTLPLRASSSRSGQSGEGSPADVTGADLERLLVLFTPPAASGATGRD